MSMDYQFLNTMSKITSPNFVDKSAVVTLIDNEKKPVIFWDTCSLLDIIRLPLPERNNSADILDRIIKIKDLITSGQVISLSSEMCVIEFNNHVDNWTNNLESESKKLSKTCNNFIDFINKINLGTTSIPHIDLSFFKIEVFLVQLTHSIIDKTKFIEESSTFKDFAHFRLKHKIAPAKKKGEYKDCYIWGTCLEVRQSSIDKSYSYSFMSSNIDDYAAANKKDFETVIANEAALNNITYFPNFNIAYGNFKKQGII